MLQAFISGLFRLQTFFVLLGLAALAALVWFAGPLLSFGGYVPLASAPLRMTIIAGLFIGTFLIGIVRIYLAQRANAQMIRNLLDTASLAALADNQASDEIEIIRERFEQSLKILREASIGKQAGRGYLFELPWYIIIGPAGAGKTTILKNSGLNFPLAERLGSDPVSGMGGTRNCDWWFTDEAVLIDTAGRYTTQDVNSEVDRAAWRGFLELLLKHRRRRPINGVILAISLGDIITQNAVDRRRHVDAIKQRLQELMRSFGLRLPVYVVLTKCDLVAGFSEYFDNLEDDERAQVWGVTFPTADDNQLLRDFDMHHVRLGERIEAAVPARMNEERNISRRCRIYCFPKEFASLRPQIGSFLADVFRPSRFEMQPMLRGVYYTSGTQEGTPIDRLLGAMARNFGLSTGHRLPFSGKGKTFFIRDVLTEVIFQEQGLVGTNRTLERKMATAQTVSYAGMAVALLCASLLWFSAYARSEIQVGETKAAAQRLRGDLAKLPRGANFPEILPVLNEAKTMSNMATDNSVLGLLQSFGLSAKAGLAPEATTAYDSILVHELLPAFAARIAARISDGLATTGADVGQLRNLLRVYLMLGNARFFDHGTVAAAADKEATLAFPLDPRRKTAMTGHLDRLVALLPKPVTLDQRLIDSARSRLTRVPQVEQIYAELLREGYQDQKLHDIDLLGVIGSTSLEATPDARGARSLTIPGIFTRDGFFNFVLPRLPALVHEQMGADWVTGGNDVDNSVVQKLSQEVARRYIHDYIAAWQTTLSRVGVIKFTDLPRALTVLQTLAGPQSPLDQLIDTVRQNVDLPPPGQSSNLTSPNPSPTAPPVPGAGIIQAATGAAGNVAVKAALGDMPWPGQTISEPFVPLLRLVMPGTSGQMPAIGKIHDLLSNLYGTMSNIANAPQPTVAAFQLASQRSKDPNSDALGNIRADAVLRPEPVRTIMQGLARTSWNLLLDLTQQQIDAAWKRDVVPVCQSAVYNRYPIYADSNQDIQLADFSQFFRPGGTMDDFFTTNLAPFVIDRGGAYVPATIDGASLPLLPTTLAAFYRAKQVREAFFSGREPAPGVKFSLKPGYLSPSLFRATLNFDGQEITYRHGPPRSYDLHWPNRNDASTVSVTFQTVDGKDTKVEQTGPWALFRFIDPSVRGNFDHFVLSVKGPGDARVTYNMSAASMNNPFGLGALRSFRCPDRL
ncbi:MAG: type VI secretion system membrane subunit TssM [Methylovirgula sp.]